MYNYPCRKEAGPLAYQNDNGKSTMFGARVLAILAVVVCVHGHGRLWEPAGRGTEWRKGFPVPEPRRDYNDNEVYCGGRGVSKDIMEIKL